MHAKVVYEGALEEDASSKTPDTPDFLSDVTSTAVEIGSSVDDSEKLSMTDSHRSTSSVFNEAGSRGELNSEHTAGDPLANKSSATTAGNFSGSTSILDSIMEVANQRMDVQPREEESEESEQETKRRSAQSAQKTARPISAPIRSVPMGGSYTLPHSLTGGELKRLKEKRVSLGEEREKRRASIEEGTRAALQYVKHRKTESLPRQYRSSSLSQSLGSEEEFRGSHDRKSSSPAVVFSPVKVAPETPPTPLNLRNMSIDETREASFNQMDEIWRQVESGSDDFQLLPDLESSFEAISNKRPHSPHSRPAHMSDFSTSSSSAKESDQSGSKEVLDDEQLSPVRTSGSITAGTISPPQGGLQHHSEPSDPEVITESDVEVSLDEPPPQMQSTPIHGVAAAADTNEILMEASPRNDPSVNMKRMLALRLNVCVV